MSDFTQSVAVGGCSGRPAAAGSIMTARSAWEVNARVGLLRGYPIIEDRHMPPHRVYLMGNALVVRSAWSDFRLPLILADNRKAARAHLAGLVAAAEKRLGLAS